MHKTTWTHYVGELCGVMESTNLMDKYAVLVQRNGDKVVRASSTEKVRKICKDTICYFLKADKKHSKVQIPFLHTRFFSIVILAVLYYVTARTIKERKYAYGQKKSFEIWRCSKYRGSNYGK